MAGETELATLLQAMQPELRSGTFVFVSVPEVPEDVRAVATVREDEGWTLVLDQDAADAAGLQYDFVAAMITLRVHSALAAVGLTAAVATALADAGISCNVLAGYFHDHLFVPAHRSPEAMRVLSGLASGT